MDYVVGSVAALVSGNVTPNRPRLKKRALTPTKHQPSPNVTPKSELLDDRSIFLSPSMQKKKAIVKKSPKRIFQNPDLETTDNGESNNSFTSPKADKVKKHLQGDLDSENSIKKQKQELKSNAKKDKIKATTPTEQIDNSLTEVNTNENTPKKKKNKNNLIPKLPDCSAQSETVNENISVANSPKPMKNKRKSVKDDNNKDDMQNEIETQILETTISPKKKKSKLINLENVETNDIIQEGKACDNPKKKNKRRKNKTKQKLDKKSESKENIMDNSNTENIIDNQDIQRKKNKKHKKAQSQLNTEIKESKTLFIEKSDLDSDEQKNEDEPIVNPNAVTEKESDSEHESDDNIDSENEEINKNVFKSELAANESSDEDDDKSKEDQSQKPKPEKKKEITNENSEVNTEDEIKRTLFIGNVLFSPKCKKEIKKIFNKHGQIETIRIRTVPVKDGRYTPKLAVIKNELHPERSTVNVYIRYATEESVEKALSENNTVLNDHHLRVSRSSHTGAEHDPKCSIFVGNLPFSMEDEVLRQKFEKCGEIESVRIIRDKKTNAGKGFGYVNFSSKDGVELALALSEEDLTIKNRIIRVKRCTQLTNKQKQIGSNNRGFKNQFNQRSNQSNQRVQGQNQGHQRGQGQNQGYQRGQGQNRGYQGNQGFQRNQGGQRPGTKDEEGRDGAHRRIMHKRQNQGNDDGPPNKRQNTDQEHKEKKGRKEFVGMTAEKKKKRKFDKGQKKKKALSEILTK